MRCELCQFFLVACKLLDDSWLIVDSCLWLQKATPTANFFKFSAWVMQLIDQVSTWNILRDKKHAGPTALLQHDGYFTELLCAAVVLVVANMQLYLVVSRFHRYYAELLGLLAPDSFFQFFFRFLTDRPKIRKYMQQKKGDGLIPSTDLWINLNVANCTSKAKLPAQLNIKWNNRFTDCTF